jgi:hypothetical protein
MASYELRIGDTYPAIPVLLSDSSSSPGIDLTNVVPVTGVHFALKGTTAALITGIFTIGQVAITATVTSNSATITSVSPVTGYSNGATLTGTGIPSGTTILSGAGTSTITMSAQASAAAPGAPETVVVNQGLVYIPLNAGALANGFATADTYTGEARIHWAAGGIQTVPNAVGGDFTILVDTDEAQE